MKHFGPDVARRALAQWTAAGADASVRHLGTSASAVYEVAFAGRPAVLRLTDVAWRPRAQCEAECAFVAHAARSGARVAAPIASLAGRLVEDLDGANASLFEWAPGDVVAAGDPRWGEPFFTEWGRSLARLHAAAATYDGPSPMRWTEEELVARADERLGDDGAMRARLTALVARIESLPWTRETFGPVHADFGAQNFRVSDGGAITAIDFGNVCLHHHVVDLVISLSTLRREPDRARWRDALLAGYRELREPDPRGWAERETFLAFRYVYVYLSRLLMQKVEPTEERARLLVSLRALALGHEPWL